MKKHFFRTKFLMFITLTLVPICIFGFILVFSINVQVKKEALSKTMSTSDLMEQYIGELTNSLEFYKVAINSDAKLHLSLVSILSDETLRAEPLQQMEQ